MFLANLRGEQNRIAILRIVSSGVDVRSTILATFRDSC